jgi:hypothetical protein
MIAMGYIFRAGRWQARKSFLGSRARYTHFLAE